MAALVTGLAGAGLCFGQALTTPPAVTPLDLGQPVRTSLAGGATHRYAVGLAAGQLAKVSVRHLGLDVRVRVSVPGSPGSLEVDGVQTGRGAEVVLSAAESACTLGIEVRAFDEAAPEGVYEIVLDALESSPSSGQLAAARAWKQTAAAGDLSRQDEARAQTKVREAYARALALWASSGDRRGQAEALHLFALVRDRWGEKKEALDLLGQAAALQRAIGDEVGEASTLADRGAVYDDMGRPAEAVPDLEQALAQFRRLNDSRGESRALLNLASVHDKQGNKDRASAGYSSALEICRSNGDRFCQAAALNDLGRFQSLLGQPQEAVGRYREALELWQAVGEKGFAAWTVMNLGAVEESIGRPRDALGHYEVSLRLNQETGDRRGEAFTLHNRAAVYAELGESQAALDDYQRALVLWRQTDDRRGEATTLGNLAKLHADLGEPEIALELYGRSLPLHQASQAKDTEAGTRYQLAHLLEASHRWQEADEQYAAALAIWRESGSRRKLGLALAGRGSVALATGMPGVALARLQEALLALRETQNRRGEAETLRTLALTLASLGRTPEALEQAGAALAIQRELDDRAGQAETFFQSARLERSLGDLDAARASIEAALTLVNQLRARVFSSNLRGTFLVAKRQYFRFYIDLLMEISKRRPGEGYEDLAIRANEEFHARNLLDALAVRDTSAQAEAGGALVERERDLLTRIAALDWRQSRLAERGDETAAAKIDRELAELLAELDRVQAELLPVSPRHADLTQPRLPTVSQIQEGLLDLQTLVLDYALGPERSYLWAISKSAVRSFELPAQPQIEQAVEELMAHVRAGPHPLAQDRIAGLAAALGDMLLRPAGSLAGFSRLLIVPDGALLRLSFAMLPEPGEGRRPLVVNHEIVVLPSLSILASLRQLPGVRPPAKGRLAIFADPVFSRSDPRVAARRRVGAGGAELPEVADRSFEDFGPQRLPRLPGTRDEARAIGTLLPSSQLLLALSFEARKSHVLDGSLAGYRGLHFATHALLNEKHPELSGLVLSLVDRQGHEQDGFLRLSEIYSLRLPVDLVVLSACRTALGKELEGEGLLGLTRGFIHAGASAVVSSLWKVDDRATYELMRRFYRKMIKEGFAPSAALHSAQASMWADGWRQPADWAGFIFQGDWQVRGQ